MRVVPTNMEARHQFGSCAAVEDLPRRAALALSGIVVDHLSISRIAHGLKGSWNTANTALLAEVRRVQIDDPTRFHGVRVLGVDKHVWRHTRFGHKYVILIIDLTSPATRPTPHAYWP
jgi:hypothetical protein